MSRRTQFLDGNVKRPPYRIVNRLDTLLARDLLGTDKIVVHVRGGGAGRVVSFMRHVVRDRV
jgi:hypothetical protein